MRAKLAAKKTAAKISASKIGKDGLISVFILRSPDTVKHDNLYATMKMEIEGNVNVLCAMGDDILDVRAKQSLDDDI